MEIEITTNDEIESPEFLNQIQSINNVDGSDSAIFCKLLIAFFGIGHFHERYAIGLLKYDTDAVNEAIKDEDRMEFSKDCIYLELCLKTVFKVEEKFDLDKKVTLNMIIIKVYTEIINLATASRSLLNVKEIRELTKIEQKKFDDVNDKVKNALATRNHIIQVLKEFTTKSEIELSNNIPDDTTLELITKSQTLLRKLCKWKPVAEEKDLSEL
jgi:hypothetical protein